VLTMDMSDFKRWTTGCSMIAAAVVKEF